MMMMEDYVGLSEASSAVKDGGGGELVEEEEGRGRGEEEEEEDELELGLSLGAKKVAGGNSKAGPWRDYCRILTAKDFPTTRGSRASPLSSSSSVSSSATLGGGGGGAGTKRAADSVAPDAVGSGNPPSQVVVGWPPIRAFRMNSLVNQPKDNTLDADNHKKNNHNMSSNNESLSTKNHEKKVGHVGSSRFIKVTMDGDPIGRKVDLNVHLSYETLALALEIMFHKPTTALSTSAYSTKASKLLDGSSEFALTYEDKDGDWMLVGDVPWGMFLETVKRLRIMRTSDVNGLAPGFQSSTGGLIRSQPA